MIFDLKSICESLKLHKFDDLTSYNLQGVLH